MQVVQPQNLKEGETYFVTNLGATGDYRTTLDPGKKYIVTVSQKTIQDPTQSISAELSEMPVSLTLTNIKEIQGKGQGQGWDEIPVQPSIYRPQWWNMGKEYKVPIFYKKDEGAIGMKRVLTGRIDPGEGKEPTTRITTLSEDDGLIHAAGKYGGRKTKRKRRFCI